MNLKIPAFLLATALTLVDASANDFGTDPSVFEDEGVNRRFWNSNDFDLSRRNRFADPPSFIDDENPRSSNNNYSGLGIHEHADQYLNNYGSESDSSDDENTLDTFKNWMNKPLFTSNRIGYYRPSRLVANILIFLAVVVVISVIASFVAARKP